MLFVLLNSILNAAWSTDNVVINEVEQNPIGNDNFTNVKEWIELYNPTDTSIDISGWIISTTRGETHSFTIPQNTILAAKNYYVFESGSQWLDNNEESVILRNNSGTTIDQTPQKTDTENDDRSWQRYPNGENSWSLRSSTKATSNGGTVEPEPEPPTPEPIEPEPTTPEPTTPEPEPTSTPEPEEPEEPAAPSGDIVTVYVSRVVDGDTFDTTEGYTIRLADIDAPENDEPGYLQSTEYLESLIENKIVTLDIDSTTGTDPYGRYVCLVYLQTNSTHSLNVNQALVQEGYANVDDYTNNEFDPTTWTLYTKTETIPEFQPYATLPLLLTAILFIIIYRKKLQQPLDNL